MLEHRNMHSSMRFIRVVGVSETKIMIDSSYLSAFSLSSLALSALSPSSPLQQDPLPLYSPTITRKLRSQCHEHFQWRLKAHRSR